VTAVAAVLLNKILEARPASFARSEGEYFVVSVNGGSQTGCRKMTELSNDSPRRYFVDSDGRRVLVGLTIEETFEFETLDSLAALSWRGGHVLWEGGGFPATKQQKRWLELYSKHDQAWSEWMADNRAKEGRNSRFLN
jgi:hypothetical protein